LVDWQILRALGLTPDGPERVVFGSFDLSGVRAAAALEVEVFADCVVE
jgi:hypothetical protein